MFPRSGGEKVYLEAVYRKPTYLATVVFAANAILLGFTASGCIVSLAFNIIKSFSTNVIALRCSQASEQCLYVRIRKSTYSMCSILEAAGHESGRWTSRGIALGVIFFVTALHGFVPKLGVHLMNVGHDFSLKIYSLRLINLSLVLDCRQDHHLGVRSDNRCEQYPT